MAFTFQEIQALPSYKKFLILFALLLILFGLFFYFIYMPKLDEVTDLKKQTRALEQQLVKKRRVVRNIEQFRKKYSELLEKYKESLRQLPDKDMIDMILRDIAKFEQEENLESILFKPGKELKREFYAVVPVNIQVKGTYRQIGKFFQDIANLPRIVNVRNFKLMNPKNIGGNIVITANCSIETYRYIPKPKKTTHKKGSRKNVRRKK
jgi:type IV pilus assembly protein PilO